jgi:hypothetical protein
MQLHEKILAERVEEERRRGRPLGRFYGLDSPALDRLLSNAHKDRLDNEYYSATGLVKKILQEYGPRTKPVPGPQYWTVPDGRTLVEVADELTESQETDNLEAFPLGEVIE